jgi:hypothetical protein
MNKQESIRHYLSQHMQVQDIWVNGNFCVVLGGWVWGRKTWKLQYDVRNYWNLTMKVSSKEQWEADLDYFRLMSVQIVIGEQGRTKGSIDPTEALQAVQMEVKRIAKGGTGLNWQKNEAEDDENCQ